MKNLIRLSFFLIFLFFQSNLGAINLQGLDDDIIDIDCAMQDPIRLRSITSPYNIHGSSSDIPETITQDIFPLGNAKWIGVSTRGEYPNELRTYFSYLIQGDTIVDEITRSKLYYIPDINKSDTLLLGYFHEEDSVVYYRMHEISPGEYNTGLLPICEEYSSDYPLYDFSLEEGDVFSYTCDGTLTELIVNSVEYIEFTGKLRKKINFDRDQAGWFIYADYWMEGMGSVFGFFDGHEYIPTCCSYQYICFHVNDELLYMNPDYSECPIPNFNSIQNIKQNRFAIFPNPMESVATVQSEQPLDLIQIYNVAGALVQEQICEGESQAFIHKKSLSPGMYFVKSISQTGDIQIRKIIIQ